MFGARPAATRTTSAFILLLAARFDVDTESLPTLTFEIFAGQNVDLPLLKARSTSLEQSGRDRQDVRHHFDERDLRSERGERVGEFTDRARAYDDERLRRFRGSAPRPT
jgi:hypothetical protein